MKLSKQFMLKANNISRKDADFRLEEFKKYNNLHPDIANYPTEKMKEIWPDSEFFTFENVEGNFGVMDGKLLFVFRGTDGIIDWIFNFLFWMKKVTPYKDKISNKKIKVHYGFYKNYLSIRNFIHEKVKESNLSEVVFHGHSKGAALAALAALDVFVNFPQKNVGSFVLGMPKIGNSYFKESFEKRLVDFIRIEYGSDLIPQIPPSYCGYLHIGNFFHIGPPRRKGIGTHKDHNWNIYFEALTKELKEEILYP